MVSFRRYRLMGTDEDYETSYRYQSVTRFSMQILIRRMALTASFLSDGRCVRIKSGGSFLF